MVKVIEENGIVFGEESDGCDFQPRVSRTYESAGSVSFSTEEIRYYLEGLIVTPDGEINRMLYEVINLLDDYEDGIEAVFERKKQMEFTDWHVLLKRNNDGSWECLAVVNPVTMDDSDIPEEWDLCLPVPKPETICEWQGL